MLRVWTAWRGSATAGHLPDGGGALDQAAIMMDALAIMDAAWSELEASARDR
jgi:hypothetical protein